MAYMWWISLMATIASLTISLVGLPMQIWKNYKQGSTDGIATPLIFTTFLTYSLWSIHAWGKDDWNLLYAYFPGSICGIVLLGQYIYYKMKKKPVIE